MTKDIPYNAAIIGCGRIGGMMDDDPKRKKIMTHAASYAHCPDVRLAAASDIDRTRLDSFGKRWQVEYLYTDYTDMLEKEDIDILSICTHSDSHHEIIKKALECNDGIKAVFCEKQIGRAHV